MTEVFQVNQLVAGYSQVRILNELTVSIPAGKVTTIIGPNGCGKSTLLKTLGRILKKDSGDIFLQQQNMNTMSTREIAQKLAILSQSPSGPGQLKVFELIAYGRYPHRKNLGKLTEQDKEKIAWAMDITNTSAFAEREISALSGGQRQRVWLAMALAQETDILLLDEPTTYLDMAHQLEVLEIVEELNKNLGCTIVMVLHDLNHAARYSHELIAIKDGQIQCCGTPNDIMTNDMLKKVFNIDAQILYDEHNIPVCFSYKLIKEKAEKMKKEKVLV
ncbi:ABC transporter ATP-binding protein [Metasolibacillus meyeri]|uniref:ABC transporter ATP-binding protein n=1 Tax=Metasolibacillus meyeri TaxID=1071052 RepID=A0AAW9NUN8_9BACL|nr:ABC transporter ATP-binding protein [Metasolibacillus meyeri]MEC1179034.1 ABC transporter ATP-binding protein [Metasolibacillus meyeri]